jgi:mono/diheme cytochrome c family protein
VAKSDLDGIEYSPQTLMPADYGSTLSRDELNDVVSYLMSVASASESETTRKAAATTSVYRLEMKAQGFVPYL